MMEDRTYRIRKMTRQELDIAVDWAAAEGWNPGLFDADCFYAADPDGFLVGLLGDEPVATISAVKYGGSFGFLGFYIVKPSYRGQGFGLRIWQAALSDLEGRTAGLDGVIAQQENYQRSGFVTAFRNIRYQGTGGGDASPDPGIVPLSELDFDEINAYDRPFFPDDRKSFLKCWIHQPRSIALGVAENRRLSGFGVLRICRTGYKIGPLFADSPEFAERLFAALKSRVPAGVPVFLDTPEVNAEALRLAGRHEMTVCFETARMYSGKAPELPMNRIFGITTFELG